MRVTDRQGLAWLGTGAPVEDWTLAGDQRVQPGKRGQQGKRRGKRWHQKARLFGVRASPISYLLNMSFKKEGVCPREWDPRDWVYWHLFMKFVIKGRFLFDCH